MQNRDDKFERFGDSAVNRFIEGACLFLEDSRDGFEGVAAMVESLSKWMLCQSFARLLFILLQSRVENDRKVES
jgi:hypothetical protein